MDSLRPLLWIAFGVVMFLLWQQWQAANVPPPAIDVATSAPSSVAVPPPVAPNAGADVVNAAPATTTSAPTAANPASTLPTAPSATPAVATGNGVRVHVRTDVLDLEIDTQGGDIVRADLLEYAVAKDQAPRVQLLAAEGAHRAAVRAGVRSAEGAMLDARTVWSTDAREVVLADGSDALEVVLRAPLAEGVVAEKVYTFRRGDYAIGLALRVRNAGAAAWRGDAWVQLDKHLVPVKRSMFSPEGMSYEGVAYHDGEKYQKLPHDTLDEKAFEARFARGWIANLQHYFLVAALPVAANADGAGEGATPPTPVVWYAKALGELDYAAGFVMPTREVAAGQVGEFQTVVYVGPKLQDRLEHVAPGLALSTDYGMFTVFAQPLFWLLNKLHGLFGNWGWAIIGLTVLIKLLFYYPSEISGRSMAKMRTVAPKLEQIKERYKDDRQKLNEAMLELYRKEKINPVSGCLPILITLPVFIALYWVLLESVEMRQAPWTLWIHDLSAKDPFFVLPLLMGVAMFLQMRLNPPPPDPVQAKVMQFMPVLFTAMSAFFPSGLTLYWLVNTVLSAAQQWQINRVVEREAAARKR